jgi:hypothetical protein
MESNAAKPAAARFGQMNSNFCCRGNGIGHQPLTAGFVDRRPVAVGYPDAKASRARGKGSRDSGGSAANYENVSIEHEKCPATDAHG